MKTRHAALGLLLLSATPAFAWRETGHFAVCEIAYRNITATTKAAIDAILGGDYATQCTWPDQVRKSKEWKHTYAWHMNDVEDGATYVATAKANPKGDAVRAILELEDDLRDPSKSAAEKKNALRFLGHVYGDLHQPLHVGRKADGGGNSITVKYFGAPKYDYAEILRVEPADTKCDAGDGRHFDEMTGECVVKKSEPGPISLHKVWDLHLFETYRTKANLRAETGDSEYLHKAFATSITRTLSAADRAKLLNSMPLDWLEESRAMRAVAYSAKPNDDLGEAYYQKAMPIVKQRVFDAGIRLAGTLDRIFDPQSTAARSPAGAFQDLRRRELEAELGETP